MDGHTEPGVSRETPALKREKEKNYDKVPEIPTSKIHYVLGTDTHTDTQR